VMPIIWKIRRSSAFTFMNHSQQRITRRSSARAAL
jgi:hypothetical protein